MCGEGIANDESKHGSVGSVINIIFGKVETPLVAQYFWHDDMADFV